jgi:iron complex transport system substrate-binding protein
VRVVSLLPAGTEIVAALGAAIGETAPTAGNGPRLVGVSHECDFPPDVRALPRVTRTSIDPAWASGEIDRVVAAAKAAGRPAITIDAETLSQLRADVVLGQSVCDVCAVGDSTLAPALATLPTRPLVVMLHAHTLDGVFADIGRVAHALDLSDEAEELVAGMRYRLRRLQERTPTIIAHHVPRTVVLEWLDPPYVAGHWVPELVALAGGEDVGNVAGARSMRRGWTELLALAPDRVVIALCGFDEARGRREVLQLRDDEPRRLFSRGVEFLDGNAYTSRPGPRLVDAAERLARLIGR